MYAFNSTSVTTGAVKRIMRVSARMKIRTQIASAGVYNCRNVAGSSTYSQHSWGNAIDFFPKAQLGKDVNLTLRQIADKYVFQATHRTVQNHFRKLPISQVIDHNNRRIWERGKGWFTYTGTTGAHVHVSGEPMREGTPPCA